MQRVRSIVGEKQHIRSVGRGAAERTDGRPGGKRAGAPVGRADLQLPDPLSSVIVPGRTQCLRSEIWPRILRGVKGIIKRRYV